MSETLSADDPYARTAQVYPKLPAALIARAGAYGAEELIRPRKILLHRGDRRADFFLVVEGEVAITRIGRDGGEETLTVIGPGNSPVNWITSARVPYSSPRQPRVIHSATPATKYAREACWLLSAAIALAAWRCAGSLHQRLSAIGLDKLVWPMTSFGRIHG
jgi:hypothetical protein